MHKNRVLIVAALLGSAALPACSAAPSTELTPDPPSAAAPPAPQPAPSTPCTPVTASAANTPNRQPAFPGQTRACEVRSDAAFDVKVVANGLQSPWSVEPLPDGSLLVTEKPGRIRIISADGQVGQPVTGIPAVDARGQGGLLDAALSPTFATDRTVYWSFTEPREGGNGTSVARGVLSTDRTRLEQVRVILRTRPTYANNMHFGSRLAFGPDGMLYVTTGERSDQATRPQSQQLDSHLGKTLRIQPDGSPAPGNPFTGQTGALPEIWSLGHRNIQAASFDPQGRFWVVEHGPRGGDELNLVQAGKNYGWPLATYGIEYSGAPIAGAETQRPGLEQPVYYWDPVVAPSGAQFYTGDAFPAWRGSLFVGALREMRLVRMEIEDGRVTGEEHLLTDRRQRIRDVRQGPDGALYLVTDGDDAELLKIVPRS